jgi:L-methionine (R)-S-oxide reductase
MSETLKVTADTKEGKYRELLPQIKALVESESDPIANMANVCAALKYGFNFFWVGFYTIKGPELVLGPFQGPVACTRIQKGRGVCGTAWEREETIIVPDVEKFPGHIACNSESKSEIVLPLYNASGEVAGVLDVDSNSLDSFDDTDAEYLAKIVALLKF